MKNPAVLLYTSDFITGTLFMSNEEVGAYIRILCMQHQKGHLTKKEIIQICKSDEVFKSIIVHFKEDKDKLYFNERMDLEKEKRTKYSESRANNRKKKEQTYEKDMKKISKTYEKHMENENENINENNNNKNIYKKEYFNNKELNDIFIEFLKIRIKLKAVNSERAINMLLKKLNNYDDNIKFKMIEQSIIKSWKDIYEIKNQSIEPEWMNKEITKEELTDEQQAILNRIREAHRKQETSEN